MITQRIGFRIGARAFALLLLVGLPVTSVISAPPGAIANALPRDSRLDQEAVERLGQMPSVDIAAIDKSGAPTVLTVQKGIYRLDRSVKGAVETDIRSAAEPLLRAQGYQPADLSLRKHWVDELGHLNVVFDQSLAGLPVVGGEVRVHFDSKGNLLSLSGLMRKSAHARLSAEPLVSSATAEARGLERTSAQNKHAGKGRLVFLNSTATGDLVLAWEVKVTGDNLKMPVRDLVYIDAATGAEIERHPLIHNARQREIYDANQRDILDHDGLPYWGILARSEGGPPAPDPDVNTNYTFMGQTYDYFWEVFGWDSYNGLGASIDSTVDFGGRGLNFAFWHREEERFGFGDGDTVLFSNLTNSRDVVAHEFTHGVTHFTSRLVYANEPGAINEAMSDIFGAMADAWIRGGGTPVIDANTWKIAEDVYTPGIAGDALRYMDNPTADGRSIDWYPNYPTFGGVHSNSGIANLAFKLAVTGGRHPRWSAVGQPLYVPPLGADAAQRIFHRANTVYLSSTDGFAQLRAKTAQAAQDLANAGQAPGNAAQVMHLVWDSVAVGGLPTGNSRPINISTRSDVGTGAAIAIAGFVVAGGPNPHDLLIRGIGPTLGGFGVPDFLPDPYLALYAGPTPIAFNDNWYQAANAPQIASTAAAVGAFALLNPSLDAAILRTFTSGLYTVQLSGVNGGTGNGMVEVYATDYNNPNHLVNISTRCLVTANPAIAGFVVQGEGYKRLLIRAVGPTLGAFGVPTPLSDPKLTLFVRGTAILENDNWSSSANASQIASAAQAVGAFALPSGSLDAALLLDLPPGTYTAHMNGVGGATGIGLIEVYEVN